MKWVDGVGRRRLDVRNVAAVRERGLVVAVLAPPFIRSVTSSD